MTFPHIPAEVAHLDSSLPSTITPSMLDDYLAAVASGPHFAMPDPVLPRPHRNPGKRTMPKPAEGI